jgi:hypothetical protein
MPRISTMFSVRCDCCGDCLGKDHTDDHQVLEVSSLEELYERPEWKNGWKRNATQYDGETFTCPDCVATFIGKEVE